MTLILAVRCAEGLVLGADGQATDTSGGPIVFATRHVTRKLFPLGNNIAWGGTGNGGLIQRFDHACQQIDPELLGRPIEELRATLAQGQRGLQRQAQGEVIQGLGGQQIPTVAPLFAGYTDGRPWILEVTAGGEDTLYDDFYAVGSGGTFAKQAMMAVAHYDLHSRSLAEAQVIVWRAIDGCIATSAFGIGHPIHLCSVTPEGVTMISNDDLRGVEESVNLWKSEELEALGRLGLGRVAQAEESYEEEVGIEPPGAG
jgi:proteasome beta subunit